MKFIYFLLIILFTLLYVPCNSFPQKNNFSHILTPIEIASNFLRLYPDSIVYRDQNNSKKWNYEQGLMLEAFYQMWNQFRGNVYLNYIKKNLDYYIDNNGKIKTYKLNDQNLYNLSQGRELLSFNFTIIIDIVIQIFLYII